MITSLKNVPFTGFLSQFVSHPVPQPDNAEYLLQKSGVTLEACLAGKRMDEKGPLFWTDMSEFRAVIS